MRIEEAFIVKNPYIPNRLYKYRSFTKYHLKALHGDFLWMSSPDRFNDPYDSAVYFDVDRFLIEDRSVEEVLSLVEDIQCGNDSADGWVPERIERPIQYGAWLEKIARNITVSEPTSTQQNLLNIVHTLRNNHNREMVAKLNSHVRSGFGVLSLSENPLSVPMWSHYSENHKGFCIEYDFSQLLEDDPRRRMCFPILYRRKLTNATRYMCAADKRKFNNLFAIYLCLLKSDEWSYEKEWRIVYAIGVPHANMPIPMPKPMAILLGVHVSKSDSKSMRDFARQHGILLKQVSQRHDEFRLEVRDF